MNSIERTVANSLEEFKIGSELAKGKCWCPACEADVMALTLTRLPPGYYTRFGDEGSPTEKERECIQQAVEESARRVARFPRHDRFTSSSPQARLINFNVEEGTEIVKALSEESILPCDCLSCCSDILTYSLNRVQPRYGVERDGQVDLPDGEKEDIRQRVAVMIALASGVVAGRPSHP